MPLSNQLRRSLESGDIVFGATTTTRSPTMIDVFGEMDFDYVWIDHEHVGPASADGHNFEMITRAAMAAGIEPICRIESGDPSVIRKVLDAGIRTIAIPRVETFSDVRKAVEASRFSYDGGVGERGIGSSLASNWGNFEEGYTVHEDNNVIVGVMLENKTALENIDEIVQVPGLGFTWIGPADLSISLGHPLDFKHREVEDAINRFKSTCFECDVPIGINAPYVGGIEAAIDEGYQLITIGSDVGAVREVLGDALKRGRRILE